VQLLRRHCTSSSDLTGGAQEVWLSCPRVVIVMQRSLLLIEEAERADGTPLTLLLGKDGDPQRHMWIHCSKRVLSLSLSLSLSFSLSLSLSLLSSLSLCLSFSVLSAFILCWEVQGLFHHSL